MLHIAISVKMHAVMLIVGDTAMWLVSDGTLISLRSSDLNRGSSCNERMRLMFSQVASGFPAGDPTKSLALSSEHFELLLLAPTSVLLWACLLPVLPKSGSSSTGSVGSQVRSYTGAVW